MSSKPARILHDGVEFIIQYREDIAGFEGGVVTKQPKDSSVSPTLLFQLENEWAHTANLNIKGVRKALKLDQIEGKTTLILEYFKGNTLRETFKNRNVSNIDFLNVAISISAILAEIHSNKIIHKDINSKNILVSDDLKTVQIIDLGISTKLNLKADYLVSPDKLEGSLAYISPEQTCRMNRVVDYRSDLYSLGVVFYELLTGNLPFEASDPMEFIHCHIAKTPKYPSEIDQRISPIISDLVMKLLAKNAEDRYQSSLGLKNDLETILEQVKQTGKAEKFLLAQNDFSGKFLIPEKLYGRETELQTLMYSFENVANGKTKINLITGFSGVGKSSLVHEIHKPITEQRGYFIEGKFDQFKRNIPYQAFIQAFKSFIQQRLTENEEKLAQWKFKLKDILGDNAGLITSVIPDFELIVGKQEKPTLLNPLESQNRFNFTFQHFIKAMANADHPLVFFMDDMQWADLASIELLKQIILDDSIHHMLLILSYRDNEITGDHPFMMLLAELNDLKKDLDYIRLKGLSEQDIGNLLAETLNYDNAKVMSLAKKVSKKTDGNPYYTIEFLRSLHANDLIRWDSKNNHWLWDEIKINEMSVTENVVQFLARRLLSYSAESIIVIQYAACIGNKFSMQLLTEAIKKPHEYIDQIITTLIEESYIIPLHQHKHDYHSKECRFAHDRFQQAVYSLLSEEDKIRIHYEIGQVLLKSSHENPEKMGSFELVGHLNEARSLITKPEDLIELCHLNYDAGVKARNSNAHRDSLEYFKNAFTLLPSSFWKSNFDFSFNVLLAKAEAEYLNLNIEEADKNIDTLLSIARNNLEKAKLLERKLIHYVTLGDYEKALKVSRECLSLLGIKIPKSSMGKIFVGIYELLKAKYLLRNKKPADLINLPEVSTEKDFLLGSVLSQTVTPAYFFDLLFYMDLILVMTNFSIKKGNSITSPHAFVSYGVLCIHMFKKYNYGYEFGKVALQINQKYHSNQVRGKLTANLAGGIYHWMMPLKDVMNEFYNGYKYSIEGGDFNYASINIVTAMAVHLRAGRKLSSVFDDFSEYTNFIERTKDNKIIWEQRLYNITINQLRGKTNEIEILEFEKSFVEVMKNNNFNLGSFYTLRVMNCFLLGETDKAVLMSKPANKLRMFYNASPLECFCVFFSSMALVSDYTKYSTFKKYKIRKKLSIGIREFTNWEKNYPENFSCYKYLLLAEQARIQNNTNSSIGYYKMAANEAANSKYVHIEALAYELLGKFCLQNNLSETTDNYLKRSIELYDRWGATHKVALLQTEFPNLKFSNDNHTSININDSLFNTKSGTFSSANLDLFSVMKASIALSEMVRFNDLLGTMMKILIENAGAEKGYFILEKGKELMSQQMAEFENKNIHLLIGTPLDNKLLPSSLLQFVARTGEEVVIENASYDVRFSNDEYILRTKPKSLLCMPIINKGELTGLIYLENNLVEGAFTKNKLELLKMLSGQITVSIENSLLYENLEQKVKQRTSQLSDEKKKSDDLLLNILPEEIAEELKLNGQSEAKLFENVTVLFTDFVNFTGIGEKMSPKELVQELHLRFTAFDAIMDKYGLEKIKTIGDAYLAVGGLPIKRTDHAEKVIEAALELQHYIQQKDSKFQVRIGVHSGAVVAGIVGVKKFAYDIWGDTVNTASRMESSSEPGKINISETTFNLIKDKFNCTPRGKIEVKGKGEIDMYFVNCKI